MFSLPKSSLRLLYRIGWRLGPGLPAWLQPPLVRAGSRLVMWRRPAALEVLRTNLEVAADRPVDDRLVLQAVESYARMLVEAFTLPGWSPTEVTGRVVTTGEQHLRGAFASVGAVVALPHSGNWDLAGAWACLTAMPVSTVAERLPSVEFAAFLRFREGLGMQVLAHDDPKAMSKLVEAVGDGRLVCLVSDRDLGGTGVPVRWGRSGVEVRMPAGPAVVARRSGGALVPAVCSYRGSQMLIAFGAPIPNQEGREGLTAMTQQVADFFADQIAGRPQDWHMMQPFFTRPAAT